MARDDNERMMTGLFPNRASAEQGYSSLMSCGYRADDVSVLMMDETRKRQFPADAPKTELGTKATEGAGLGAVTGGTLGALLLGLSAAGFAIPGIPIIALGPLAAVLSGAGLGGAVGGLIGAFVGAGIPEERAREYEEGLKRGGIVLAVTPKSHEDADRLEREWMGCGCERLHRPPRVPPGAGS
jgi:hypothetical protein